MKQHRTANAHRVQVFPFSPDPSPVAGWAAWCDEMNIDLLLCINNLRGRPTGAISILDVFINHDLVLGLESTYWPESACACKRFPGGLLIHERVFPYHTGGILIGNVFWDRVTVTVETANDLLNYLCDLKVFGVEEGRSDFFEAWQANRPLDLSKIVQ